eukprot:1564426-Pleurochrysis_carterae.AAC.1
MHVLSADHGGRSLRLRTLAFASTGVAYAIVTCTAVLYGLLLVPLGRLMCRWVRLPSQGRDARRTSADAYDSLHNATLLSCARTDAIH